MTHHYANNLSEEKINQILSMQDDIRNFLDLFEDQDRLPFNAHRIGVYQKDKEKAIDLGGFNYSELLALHTYIKLNHQSKTNKTTFIDYISHKGSNVKPYTLSEDAYKTELSIISWLGSNVGLAFLNEYIEKLNQK